MLSEATDFFAFFGRNSMFFLACFFN